MARALGLIREECKTCEVGVASGTREGAACAFVDGAWRKDSHVFRQGDEARHAWYIKSGMVVLRRRASSEAADGDGHVRAIRFAGSFVGLEVLVGDHYNDTAITSSNTVLCGVPRAELDHWIGPKNHPARTALEMTLRTESTELRRLNQHEGSALQRTAAWLCDETPRLQSVALQRREIADLLNMRAETLSRVLARLSRIGAVTVTRSHVRISDVGALQAAAAGE